MGIQPPSDLVFDVVKAADATRSREVIGKLRALAKGGSDDFGTSLAGVETGIAPLKAGSEAAAQAATLLPASLVFSGTTLTGLRNAHALSQQSATSFQSTAAPGAKTQAGPATLRKFEAMMLSQFIDAMMPASSGVFGSGAAGSTWKSLLTEKLGAGMADAGGIGMATKLARATVVPDRGSRS